MTECECPRPGGVSRPRLGRGLIRVKAASPTPLLFRRRSWVVAVPSVARGGPFEGAPVQGWRERTSKRLRGVARRPGAPSWWLCPAGLLASEHGAKSPGGAGAYCLACCCFRNAEWPGGTALAFILIPERRGEGGEEREERGDDDERDRNITPP